MKSASAMHKNLDKSWGDTIHRTEVENGLVALNQVHYLAAKLWKEEIPTTPHQKQKHAVPIRNALQRRITPVQLPARATGHNVNAGFGNIEYQDRNSRSTSFCEGNPSRKRAQIKSLPRKPPDIQNLDLFPPITSAPIRISPSPACVNEKSKGDQSNPFAATAEEPFDPRKERRKMCKGVQKIQNSSLSTAISPEVTQPLTQPIKILQHESPSRMPVQSADKGRSAELFAQLTPEQLDAVKKLSSSFSNSLDFNRCPSILAEITLLCQLLVANNDDGVAPLQMTSDESQLLAGLAPRVLFVTTVFDLQLPLISKLSPDVIQMLIDFYPHRIPKSLRKRFEFIIKIHLETETEMRLQSRNKFSSIVVFQNETDGRNNFPHQKDCQDFGKQRDLFYAIREIWASRHAPNAAPPTAFDPAYAKVKQLFQTNSSSTNLSRLASLFLSQSLLDLNDSEVSELYEPSSVENVQRIFQSNPSKYEKLRQRLSASNSTLEGHHQSIPDPMAFLKYFVKTAGSFEFMQHLIDLAIHDIHKMEIDITCDLSAIDSLSMMRKSHLMAQFLGFLWFLPYRDDEYKKPIGPINVEIYLQSRIKLRSHQAFPLNLTQLLISAMIQKRLVFTLPWILEFLARGDHVSFHLPAYKQILSLVSSIYREILPAAARYNYTLAPENRTLLRFLCGKLFGFSSLPNSYLFGADVKSVTEFVPDLSSPLSPTKGDDAVALDLTNSIGSTLLSIWFRPEMTQMMTILSSNATVKGSIPSDSPGIVKHIPPLPEQQTSFLQQENYPLRNLQQDLEVQFFHTHPSALKKTADFVSDRVAAIFLKRLRTRVLTELRAEFAAKGVWATTALAQCTVEIRRRVVSFAQENCNEGVQILLGDSVSLAVLCICQKICVRNVIEKVMAWMSQHVTIALFPEVAPLDSSISTVKSLAVTAKSELLLKMQSGSKFFILRALHNTIQRLHNNLPIDDALVDQVLEDGRLPSEKPWVTYRTFDLAMCLVTFAPATLTADRLMKFVKFWKTMQTNEHASILCPRNFLLFSNSLDLKSTFAKLSTVVKALLKEKLLGLSELQTNCMTLLQYDWPVSIKPYVSEFLKEVIRAMEGTEEREVIDWIAWYCADDGDGV